MLRKIGYGLLCAAAALSANTSYSMVSHSLQPGLSVEYELPPNEPQLFVNYLFWTIDVTCKVVTEDPNSELFAEAIAKKGKVNDVTIKEGESIKLTVLPGENLRIVADPGAKVKITNQGEHTVKATCKA